MKKGLGILVVMLVVLISCNKEEENAIPTCVQDELLSFEENIACSTGASLKEYTFQSKTVYVFDPGLCGADLTSEVITDECITLGYLGGIIGNTDINGEDFANAVFQRNVWVN